MRFFKNDSNGGDRKFLLEMEGEARNGGGGGGGGGGVGFIMGGWEIFRLFT